MFLLTFRFQNFLPINKIFKKTEKLMNNSRTKNSMKNAAFGIALQITAILTKFVSATVFANILGRDFSGLNGLFTEVIAMISLAEMGVGTAIVYNLYKPLAEKDHTKLNQLMNLFKKSYRIISAVVMGIGLVLTPFIHLIVKRVDFNLGYIRVVFLLFVLQTATSYLFTYKASLLNADQKTYIVSIVNLISRIVLMALNVAVLYFTRNYIFYLIVQVAVTIMTNFFISRQADKQYKFLKKDLTLPKEEQKKVLSNIKNIFIGVLSFRITTSTDNILLSLFVGTDVVGVYYYYSLVVTSIIQLFSKVSESMVGSIGNLMTTESPQKNSTVLKRLTFLFIFLGSLFATGFYCVATPLIKFWLGDIFVLDETVVLVSAINFFFFIAREPLWKFMHVSGLFAKDKNISILGTVINLIVSVILGKTIGMIGIFIGTTCTLIIQVSLKSILLYNEKLGYDYKSYGVIWIKMLSVFVFQILFSKYLCDLVTANSLIYVIIINGIIATVTVVFSTLISNFYTPEFKYFYNFFLKFIKKGK